MANPRYRDVNEEIVQRILQVLARVPDAVRVYRNIGDIPPNDVESKTPNLPGIFFLEGKETSKVDTQGQAYGQRPPPNLMVYTPEIWVVLMPAEDLTHANVGPELKKFRAAIVSALENDETLQMILGDGGELKYRGFETDMQSGGLMEGQMRLDFSFSYILDASDLTR